MDLLKCLQLILRCQRIKLGDCLSSKADLKFRVHHRSVLGPLLFTLYTTSLSSIISRHTIHHHLYADDGKLHVSLAPGDSAAALNSLQVCLASVHSWMSTNKLKLNPGKTEFLLIGKERQQSKYLSMFPIKLFGAKTNPAKSFRNLEAIIYKISPSTHLYQESAAHAFTVSWINGVFAVTLMWIVQNHLQLHLCPVVSIIAI